MYWKYASIVIFAIFCLWVLVETKLKSREEDNAEEAFWERERKANFVRRKPIDNLDYVVIPDDLPYDCVSGNADIDSYIRIIKDLRDEKILNLTGYTNTEVKEMYGAPNFPILSIADTNYTSLVTTLQKWADELLKLKYTKEAVQIMEYSISIGTDVGKTFRVLADYYAREKRFSEIDELILKTDKLKSLAAPSIARSLEDIKNNYLVS